MTTSRGPSGSRVSDTVFQTCTHSGVGGWRSASGRTLRKRCVTGGSRPYVLPVSGSGCTARRRPGRPLGTTAASTCSWSSASATIARGRSASRPWATPWRRRRKTGPAARVEWRVYGARPDVQARPVPADVARALPGTRRNGQAAVRWRVLGRVRLGGKTAFPTEPGNRRGGRARSKTCSAFRARPKKNSSIFQTFTCRAEKLYRTTSFHNWKRTFSPNDSFFFVRFCRTAFATIQLHDWFQTNSFGSQCTVFAVFKNTPMVRKYFLDFWGLKRQN